MSKVEYLLDNINESSDSLKTLYFRPPGIFTNAILTRPEITTLIRDADLHEQSLYKVNGGQPERIDGKTNYIDPNISFMNTNNNQSIIKSAVQVPSMLLQNPNEMKDANLNKLLGRINNDEEYSVDVLCETVERLVEKYPIQGVEEKVESHKRKWQQLNEEIMKLEELVEEQRKQLSDHNINLSDNGVEPEEVNIEDVLEAEEQEIRELELNLIEKQRQVREGE